MDDFIDLNEHDDWMDTFQMMSLNNFLNEDDIENSDHVKETENINKTD